MRFAVRPVRYDAALFAQLMKEGEAGQGTFLLRLRDEWMSGAQRFERAGELLLGAFAAGRLVGIAGISHDPYAPAPGLGRVRHVYVLEAFRGSGVAALLLERLIDHARGHFAMLRLSATGRPAAIRLYERLGFVPRAGEKETHRLCLPSARPAI